MFDTTTKTITVFPLGPDDEVPAQDRRFEERVKDATDAERLEFADFIGLQFGPASALDSLQRLLARTTDAAIAAAACVRAGTLRERMGQFERAAGAYAQALALAPSDPSTLYFAHNNLAFSLNRLGRHAEAAAEARAAIEADPARFHAHENLGVALEGQGAVEDAARAYADSVRREKRDRRALRRLRRLLARRPGLRAGDPSWLEGTGVDEHAVPAATARVVERLLGSIRVGDSIGGTGGLQVFGLTWDAGPGGPYRTLDEALPLEGFRVTEVSDHGTVPELRLVNRSGVRVLLVSGEQLVGEKQNRVLNASLLVEDGVEMPVPVSCVEQGRWGRRGAAMGHGFGSSGTSAHSKLRGMMSMKTAGFYKDFGSPRSDQGEVWGEVSRKLHSLRAVSASVALEEAYVAEKGKLDAVGSDLTPGAGWAGALFAYGGKIRGLDLFDRPETLTRLWPKLVRSYAIDALEEAGGGEVPRADAEAWLARAASPAMEGFASPGLGTDVRFETGDVVGAMLLVDDHPYHLEAFAAFEEE